AYGLTIPIFIGRRSLSLLLSRPYPSPRALHGVAHHRSPLLLRDAVEMLAEGPVSSVCPCRALRDRLPQIGGTRAGEIGPCGPDQLRVVRIARSRLGRAE